MEDFFTGHDPDRWGKLLAEDGELFSLPDVVRVVMKARGMPHLPAAHRVLICIRDAAPARCYVTRPGLYAMPIKRPAVWPVADTQSAAAKGRKVRSKPTVMPNDLAAVLRAYFAHLLAIDRRAGFHDVDLYVCACGGQLAMHLDDVVALFGDEWRTVFGPEDIETPHAFAGAPVLPVPSSAPVPACALVAQSAAVELTPTKKPGAPWVGHETTLLHQFNHLRSAAGGGLKAWMADEKLGEVWSVCPSNVKQVRLRASRLPPCRKEAAEQVAGA